MMLKKISELLFPTRDTELLVRQLNDTNYRSLYLPQIIVGTICLTQYQHPLVRALITENKFHHNKLATAVLGKLLKTWVVEQNNTPIFVPVPLSNQRKRARGYDQVEEILKTIPNLEIASILKRSRDTQPQTSLKKTERLQNMKGAFVIKQTADVKIFEHRTVVLVDDVVTTGATLKAARASLAPHLPPSCKLICVALAH